jgi:hypothetical protein
LPVALLVKDRRRRCAACGEVVREDATLCRHCRSALPGPDQSHGALNEL